MPSIPMVPRCGHLYFIHGTQGGKGEFWMSSVSRSLTGNFIRDLSTRGMEPVTFSDHKPGPLTTTGGEFGVEGEVCGDGVLVVPGRR